jgi:hypothetical protein
MRQRIATIERDEVKSLAERLQWIVATEQVQEVVSANSAPQSAVRICLTKAPPASSIEPLSASFAWLAFGCTPNAVAVPVRMPEDALDAHGCECVVAHTRSQSQR